MRPLTISGVGCCLGNFTFNKVDFNSDNFKKYISKTIGDGGLSLGKLIFTDDFEKFVSKKYSDIKLSITNEQSADTINISGSAMTAIIHIAQLLYRNSIKVNFYGALGSDDVAKNIHSILKKTPVITTNIKKCKGSSAYTDVFSNPGLKSNTDKFYVNNLGCAKEYGPENLDINFFLSDIVLFGGTAMVPKIHEKLDELLRKAQEKHSFTVVIATHDYLFEKSNAGKQWKLVNTNESYRDIDLLIMNYDEALKISGHKSIASAIDYFIANCTGAFIITHGTNNIKIYSSGKLFRKQELIEIPVCKLITSEIMSNLLNDLDTNGCGDNFAGGVVASMAMQLQKNTAGDLDLIEACALGVVSGGFACYYSGSTYVESVPGDKWDKLGRFYTHYIKQLRDENIMDI